MRQVQLIKTRFFNASDCIYRLIKGVCPIYKGQTLHMNISFPHSSLSKMFIHDKTQWVGIHLYPSQIRDIFKQKNYLKFCLKVC